MPRLDDSPAPREEVLGDAINFAVMHGSLEATEWLLGHGVDVQASYPLSGGVTPLHHAAEEGDLDMARLLLAYGADPVAVTEWGWTPRDWGRWAGENEKEMIQLLDEAANRD